MSVPVHTAGGEDVGQDTAHDLLQFSCLLHTHSLESCHLRQGESMADGLSAHAPASTRSTAEEYSRVWEEIGKLGKGALFSWATLCIQWGPNVSAL